MDCCLWLNGMKISKADEVKDNFDIISLRGYFMGGSLIMWLRKNGGNDIAEQLNYVDTDGDVNAQLEYAFGIKEKPPVVKHFFPLNNEFPFIRNSTSSFSRSFNIHSFRRNIPQSFQNNTSDSYRSSFLQKSSFGNKSFIGFGSFVCSHNNSFKNIFYRRISKHEVSKIEKNLELHPLNRFGYGIHLI